MKVSEFFLIPSDFRKKINSTKVDLISQKDSNNRPFLYFEKDCNLFRKPGKANIRGIKRSNNLISVDIK